jgi:hypothetical protein
MCDNTADKDTTTCSHVITLYNVSDTVAYYLSPLRNEKPVIAAPSAMPVRTSTLLFSAMVLLSLTYNSTQRQQKSGEHIVRCCIKRHCILLLLLLTIAVAMLCCIALHAALTQLETSRCAAAPHKYKHTLACSYKLHIHTCTVPEASPTTTVLPSLVKATAVTALLPVLLL